MTQATTTDTNTNNSTTNTTKENTMTQANTPKQLEEKYGVKKRYHKFLLSIDRIEEMDRADIPTTTSFVSGYAGVTKRYGGKLLNQMENDDIIVNISDRSYRKLWKVAPRYVPLLEELKMIEKK